MLAAMLLDTFPPFGPWCTLNVNALRSLYVKIYVEKS